MSYTDYIGMYKDDTATLTNKTISGSDNTITDLANSALTNSSMTIAGTTVSLGGTVTIASTALSDYGSIANAALANSAITVAGTSVSLGGSVTIASTALSDYGSIANAALANSSLTVNGTTISLGGAATIDGAAGQLLGLATGAYPATGYVGEVLTNSVSAALTTDTYATITGTALTAGNWEVSGAIHFSTTGATVADLDALVAGVSETQATLPSEDNAYAVTRAQAITTADYNTAGSYFETVIIPSHLISLSTGATYYPIAKATFSAGSITALGTITFRRVS